MALLEIKADLLKTLMQEDRNEIRLIKERIFNTISFITVSSFAITSFLVGGKNIVAQQKMASLITLTDIFLVLLLSTIYIRLKIDLGNVRKCLEVREELIQDLPFSNENDFKIFPSVNMKQKSKIQDSEFIWPLSLAILAITIKVIAIIHLKI